MAAELVFNKAMLAKNTVYTKRYENLAGWMKLEFKKKIHLNNTSDKSHFRRALRPMCRELSARHMLEKQ